MGLLNRIFGRRKSTVPITVGRKARNVSYAKKKKYNIEAVITFNGKPMRMIPLTHDGYSRDKVAEEIQEGLSIRVSRVYQQKRARNEKR